MSPIFMEPAQDSPAQYRAPLLSGEAGTAQTVAVMRQLIDQAVSDASFVRSAIDIARSASAYDDLGEVRALWQWTRNNIRFTKDPVTKEKLYPPQELLKIRAGDCDDIAMLLGAMLIAVGYPARLVTIAANPAAPQEFSHVYIEAEVPPGSNNWLPVDAARPDAEFGIEPPLYFRKRAWSLIGDAFQDLSGSCRSCGLGSYGPALADGLDWSQIVTQSIQEVPQIMAVSTGQPTSVRNNAGVVATGPYSSFATPYTPGYGVAPAGYAPVPLNTTQWFGQNWPLVALGIFGLWALSGKDGRR